MGLRPGVFMVEGNLMRTERGTILRGVMDWREYNDGATPFAQWKSKFVFPEEFGGTEADSWAKTSGDEPREHPNVVLIPKPLTKCF